MNETVHVVCPNCAAVNRIPLQRLGEHPKCGKCKASLFDGHPVELTGGDLRRHLTRNDIPVLVDFWAPWCGPCKMMAPAYEQAAAQLEPRVRLAKLNTDQEPAIASEFGIRGIPTMILFRAGKEIARQTGAMGAADIARWVEAQI